MLIIAEGKQFMMFEVPGSQMANGATWTSLGINNNGTQHPDTDPYSIIENSDALEWVLLGIKARVLNGNFIDA